MKPFTQYLQEMNRIYEFSIKLAGCDMTTEMKDRLKSALETYSVESIGKYKRLPIQEHADFPGHGPCECNMLEVAVKYPVVTDQVAQLIAEKLGIPKNSVIVRTRGQEENMVPMAEPKKSKDGSVLNNPELEAAEGAQALVGQSRKDSMLKELETRKYEFETKAPIVKSPELPQGNKSPVGSMQNKIPTPVKGK
jgi:hypothetical protein